MSPGFIEHPQPTTCRISLFFTQGRIGKVVRLDKEGEVKAIVRLEFGGVAFLLSVVEIAGREEGKPIAVATSHSSRYEVGRLNRSLAKGSERGVDMNGYNARLPADEGPMLAIIPFL